MKTSRIKIVVKLLISALLLGYLIWKFDWIEIISALRSTDLSFYIGSTLTLFVLVYLNSVKFYLFLKDSLLHKSIPFIIKVNFISRYYALFFPSAIGREIVRWYKITENKRERTFFLAVTVFERLIHIFLLLCIGFIPLYIYASNKDIATLRSNIFPVIMILILFCSLGMGFFLSSTMQRHIRYFLTNIFQIGIKQEWINHFFDKFRVDNISVSLFFSILVLNFLWLLVFILRLFLLSKAIMLPLGYLDMAWMGSLVLLLQLIPITFSGIGLREGAYAYLFMVFGLPPEKGVLLGILFFSQMLILALIGSFLEFLEK